MWMHSVRLGRLSTLVLAVLWCACAGEEAGSDGPTGPPPPPPPPNPSATYAIEYSTFVGGSDFEEIREPLVLPGGRLLFGARTLSSNMPTTAGVVQPAPGGGQGDSFLAIMSADGGSLEAATYFGGSGMERPPYGIELASNGDIVFGSGTSSPNIPTSAGAYRPDLAQPVPDPGGGYVCRISADLRTLRWCTYTGGGWPRGGLTVDAQDNVIVVGRAIDPGFATTSGALQRTARGVDDGFVLKLDPGGTSAIFSTRLGGGGTEVGEVVLTARVRPDGVISISGTSTSSDFPTTSGAAQPASSGPRDSFIAALGPTGSLIYSTLLGGSDDDSSEHRHWLLPDGSILLAGITQSDDFPGAGGVSGSSDGFLARISRQGDSFLSTRTLGGSGSDLLLGPVVDSQGRIIVFGKTTSRNLPTTDNALQPAYGGGAGDGVIFILGPDGSTVEMTSYLGGSDDELIRGIAVGPSDELYVVGTTRSDDFPTTAGAFQPARRGDADGFVVKLVPTGG